MRWNKTILALVAALSVALAGCVEEPGGPEDGVPGDEEEFNTAEVTFDGTQEGPVTESVECPDGQGQLTITGDIENGTANVTVLDGNQTAVYQQNFGANDTIAVEGELLEGANGTWTVEVSSETDVTTDLTTTQQQAAFEGEIEVRLACS